MRYVLFIPVLVLFLSNVPFVQRIPMEQAMLMMRNSQDCKKGAECSRNTENLVSSCSAEKSDCSESCDSDATQKGDVECQQPESECVCICCFQYAAPFHPIVSYVFPLSLPHSKPGIFVVGHIKDPHVAAPWQPPDLV